MKKNLSLFLKIAVTMVCVFSTSQEIHAQWNPIASPTTYQLQSIAFAIASAGYAGGAEGTYKTTDGGATWTKLNYHGIDSLWLEAINIQHLSVINDLTVYIAGWNILDNAEVIIKTTDGGISWLKQYVGAFDSRFNDIYFTSASVGYVVGDNGRLLKTTNGGTQWLPVSSGTTEPLTAIHFPTAKTGYAAGGNVLLKTINGGSSWSKQSIPYNLSSLFFTDSLTGYAGTLTGEILKTTNGASTWQEYNTRDSIPFNSIRFINDSTGYACASQYEGNGQIYKTTSSGKYWEPQPSSRGRGLLACFFTTVNTGFAVGVDGRMIKTNNAGGITMPNANFTAPSVFCADSLLTFKNNGPVNYTYTWLDNGVIAGNSYSLIKKFTANSTHTISLIAQNNGYRDTVAYRFTVASSLVINLTTTIANDSICFNSEATIVVLNSETDATYTLKNGNTIIGVSQNGTGSSLSFQSGALNATTVLTMEAGKTNACATNKIQQAEAVFVFPPIQPNLVAAAVKPTVCMYDSTTVEIKNSQAGISYQLISSGNYIGKALTGNGATIALPTGPLTQTTNLRIIAKNKGGCTVTLDPVITVTIQPLTVEFAANTSYVFVDDTVQFTNTSNADSYTWNFGANSTPSTGTGFNPGKITYSAPGNSKVMLIGSTQAGCKDTAYATVSVYNKASSFNGFYCGTKALYTASSPYPYFDRILDTYVDRFGNSYVAGFYYSFVRWPVTVNMYVHCYNKKGVVRWSNVQSTPMNNGNWFEYISTYTNSISSDDYGNVYLAGSYAAPDFTFGTITTSTIPNDKSSKAFLLKLDSTGTAKWIINGYNPFPGAGISIVSASDVVVDAKNEIYLSAYRGANELVFKFPGGKLLDLSADTAEMYVLKIRQDGSLINYYSSGSKVLSLFNPDNSYNNPNEQPAIYPKMQLGACGELYIHAKKYRPGNFSPRIAGTIAHIDPITGWGQEFTAFTLENPYLDENRNSKTSFVNPFVMDKDRNFYVISKAGEQVYIGKDTVTTTEGSSLLAKYDMNGKLLWYHVYATTEFSDIAINNQQNIFFLGKYHGFGDFYSVHSPPVGLSSKGNYDVVIGEYSKDGDLIWVNQLAGIDDAHSFRFAKNSCDEIYFTLRSNTILIGNDSVHNNILATFSKTPCSENPPSAAFSFIQNGNTYVFSNNSLNATDYLWDFGDGNTSGIKSPTHTYAIAGPYLISLKVTNGSCSDFKCVSSDKAVITSITKETNDELLLYPNPNKGIFKIRMPAVNGKTTLIIYDMYGKQVYRKNDFNSSGNHAEEEINLEKLSKGIYQVAVSSDKKTVNATVVIQ